jgi:sugar phosphate isomerase/epimerase
VNVGGRELVRFTLTPKLDVVALRDSNFKRSVLTEIEPKSAGRSVTVFVREFVRGLSRVHSEIRQATQDDMQGWKSAIDGVVSVGREQFHSHVGLAVVARDEYGNHPEIIEIFEEFVQRLVALRKRYLNIGLLTEWFVSSEAV